LAEWLKEIAKKSAGALPGIIASIVSFILKAGAEVIGFVAEYLIFFVIIIISSMIYGLINGIRYIRKD
jgi:hypothetical protein